MLGVLCEFHPFGVCTSAQSNWLKFREIEEIQGLFVRQITFDPFGDQHG